MTLYGGSNKQNIDLSLLLFDPTTSFALEICVRYANLSQDFWS